MRFAVRLKGRFSVAFSRRSPAAVCAAFDGTAAPAPLRIRGCRALDGPTSGRLSVSPASVRARAIARTPLGATELVGSAPIAQWTILFGTGRVRLYATTAIPTGLYRLGLGDSAGNGAMSLSFGVISRFTWLDPDGKEGLLGLEAGVMAFALTGDQTQGAQSLTQVGAVVGAGMAIPIANPGAPTQASINLHLWVEQRLTGNGPQAGSEHALIFGPSISFGNIGTTF